MNSKKGLIVVDRPNSALWTVAHQHAQKNSLRVLSATSFKSANSLVTNLVAHSPNFVIFSWRDALIGILNSRKALDRLQKLDTRLFLLVPDHLGLDLFPDVESWLCSQVDGVLLTSRKLQTMYQDRFGVQKSQLLHDLPDDSLFHKVERLHCDDDKHLIMWIGNSEWGRRQRLFDHKGLRRYALPTFAQLAKISPHFTFQIVDSAQMRLSPVSIRNLLLRSCCLVITSDSEGTPLPLLEAASLGVPVVTFDVGISRELLSSELSNQIVSRNIDELVNRILETTLHEEKYSKTFRDAWSSYFAEIANDFSNLDLYSQNLGRWRYGKPKNTGNPMWFLRWVMSRLGLK